MKTDTTEKGVETLIMHHMNGTELEIALMQEYRTRLTADLVTGKLAMRPLSACLAQAGAAAKLPALPTASATDEAPDELELEEAEA